MAFTIPIPRMPQPRQLVYVLVLFSLLAVVTRHFWILHTQKPPEIIEREWSKIAKVTVALNNINATGLDRCIRSHEIQNEMHGYKYFVGSTSLVSDKYVPAEGHVKMSARWSKHAYMLQIMLTELLKPESERLEWLFWFDADTLILNPHISLETFLPPLSNPVAADLKLLIARNWDGINDGAFLIRIDTWSVALLSGILAYPIYHHDQKTLPHEQTVMSTILHTVPAFQHEWTVVPHRWFNSFPLNNVYETVRGRQRYIIDAPMRPQDFDDGERIVDKKSGKDFTLPWKVLKGNMAVHFAGVQHRKTWVNPWADRAEMQLPEWSGTPYQEKLQEEVNLFWEKWQPKVEVEIKGARPIDGLNNNTFF